MKAVGGAVGVVVLFILAHFGHHLLTALVVPLLPLIRAEFNLNYAASGLLAATFSLAYGAGQLPAGWVADRLGARMLLVAGIAGVAGAGVLVGLSWTFGTLAAGLVLMGLAGGGYHPAAPPLIAAAAGDENVGRALGFHLIGGSASHFIAPLLGASLAAVAGWRGAFLITAAPVALIGLVLFFALARPTDRKSAAPPDLSDTAAPGTRASLLVMIPMVFIAAAANAFLQSALAFLPLYAVDHLGYGPKTAALMLSAVYSAGFWAAPLGGLVSDRIRKTRLIPAVGIATGLGIIALGGAVPGLPMWILLLGLGACMFVRMPAAESFILEQVPASQRSTVLGLYFFAGMEGSGLLTPIIGALVDAFGFQRAFVGAGSFLVILCIAAMLIGAYGQKRSPGHRAA